MSLKEPTATDINFNYNYLVIQTILKMRDAHAQNQIREYWIYFEYAMGLVISQIDFHVRGEIEKDFAILQEAIKKIKSSNLNEQTKTSLINRLCEDFANAHRFYIMQALNRIGIVKVEDEGVIDFDKVDIDTMTKIIRDTDKSVVTAATEAENNKTKYIKPEMVAIYHKGKILQMPKEEYIKMLKDKQSKENVHDDTLVMGEMPDEPIEAESEDLPKEEQEEGEEDHQEKFWNKSFQFKK